MISKPCVRMIVDCSPFPWCLRVFVFIRYVIRPYVYFFLMQLILCFSLYSDVMVIAGKKGRPACYVLGFKFWGFCGWVLSFSFVLSWKNLLCCCFASPLGPVFTTAPQAAEGLALSRLLTVPLRCKAPVCSTCAAWPAILILPRQLQMMQ